MSHPAASSTDPQSSLTSEDKPGNFKRLWNFKGLKSRLKKRRDEGPTAALLLDISKTVTNLAKDGTSGLGVPGISIGLSVLSAILERLQQITINAESLHRLKDRVERLCAMLKEFTTHLEGVALRSIGDGGSHTLSNNTPSPLDLFRQRIVRLSERWLKIDEDLAAVDTRNRFLKFIKTKMDADRLVGLVAEMNASIDEFLLEGSLNIETTVYEINTRVQQTQTEVGDTRVEIREGTVKVYSGVQDVQAGVSNVQESVQDVRLGVRELHLNLTQHIPQSVIEGTQRMIEDAINKKQCDLTLLPWAKNARYDANGARKPCIAGTRVSVLGRIRTWVLDTTSLALAMLDEVQLCWVNGLAGTGKTTIACSVAEEFDRRHMLGGCFFFSRFDAECSDPKMIFTTLARQLCDFHPQYRQEVSDILKNDPGIPSAGPVRQLEELIVNPLRRLKGVFPPCLIVVDALDECNELGGSTSIFLSALSKFRSSLSPLFFLITSRPELHATAIFDKVHEETLHGVTMPLILHDHLHVQPESVVLDIQLYLIAELQKTSPFFRVPQGWPSPQDLTGLLNLSHGLFIYASTAVNFVRDPKYRNPARQLQRLLDRQSKHAGSGSLLYSLYEQVLEESQSDGISDELEDELRTTLGAIILAREPLSAAALAALLDFTEDQIWNTLSGLRSVLYIPEDNTQTIRIIHPTFAEYLLSSSSKLRAFCVHAPVQHHALFARCLHSMRALHYDIAGIGDPTLFKTEVPDLAGRVYQRIPPHIQYACRYWGSHLDGAQDETVQKTLDTVHDFVCKHVLVWLEACSLIGVLESTVPTLHTASRICQPHPKLPSLLHDLRRFVLTYFSCINAAPLQVYHSVLTAVPRETLAGKLCAQEQRRPSLVIRRGALQHWDPWLDIIDSNHSAIHSAAFSPDGAFFATVSHQGSIEVWNSVTRMPTLLFGPARGELTSRALAWSPDGKYLALARDSVVDEWDAAQGERIRTLDYHPQYNITSIKYLAKSNCLMTVCGDGDVKLWSTSDGRCVLTFDELPEQTPQVGISPDEHIIAFITENSLRLHNLATNTSDDLAIPGMDYVSAYRSRSAVFSSDGQYVAAAVEEQAWMWSLSDMSLVFTARATNWITSLDFSPDSTTISAVIAGSVHLWQLASISTEYAFGSPGGQPLLPGAAWSPDSCQLAVVGAKGTLQILDVAGWLDTTTSLTERTQSPSFPSDLAGGCYSIHIGRHIIIDQPTPSGAYCLSTSTQPLTACSTVERDYTVRYFKGDLIQALDVLRSPKVGTEARDHLSSSFKWAFLTGDFKHSRRGSFAKASHGGQLVAYCEQRTGDTFGSDINVVDARTSTMIASFSEQRRIWSLAFSPDGALLGACFEDDPDSERFGAGVLVWDIASQSLIRGPHRLEIAARPHKGLLRSVLSISSNGNLLAYNISSTIHLLDAWTGGFIGNAGLNTCQYGVSNMAFSRDGRHLLFMDHHCEFRAWDVENHKFLLAFSFSGGSWPHSFDFSPDDTGILAHPTGAEPTTIVLWEPGDRTWPVYAVGEDGWLYAKGPGCTHRLGWLPREWRSVLPSLNKSGRSLYVYDSSHNKGLVDELDISELLDAVGL